MKCAHCFRTTAKAEHQDVLLALGKQPKKIYDKIAKILDLSSRQPSDSIDENGNPVTCGPCYANAFTKATNGS